MKKLLLLGGGGHCHSCIDVIEQQNQYEIVGILDNNIPKNTDILGYPVLGTDAIIEEFDPQSVYVLITIGQIGSADIRSTLYSKLLKLGFRSPVIVSPRAYIAKGVKIGDGTIIHHDAVLNSCVEIGENCIINTKALVEHDAKIADNCHLSTGSIVNGGVRIEAGVFLGSNSVIIQNIAIENGAFIKANQLVRE